MEKNLIERITARLKRAFKRRFLKAVDRFRIGGVWTVECHDKFGNLKWREVVHNIVTNEGINKALDSIFHNDASATWYVALVESNTSPAAGMTYAVPTYTECTAYDEATRQEYVEAAASSQSITNSASKAVFTMNATKTLYGAALVTSNVKGDTAASGAKLFNFGLFPVARSVADDDVVNVTVAISGADDGV